MYVLFFLETKLFQYNNPLYKLFLFLYYWYSTMQNFMFPNIYTVLSECLLTNLLAAFLVVCSILQWRTSQSDSFSARPYDKSFYVKPTGTFDWMSFWYSGDMYVLISLTTWKYIAKRILLKKKTFFSCHKGLTRP